MAAPNVKSWINGALYLGTSDTAVATPLAEPVDLNYDPGMAEEAMPYAGATVTPNIVLLSSPNLAVNYNRRADEDIVFGAMRHCRTNLTGVKFYAYIDTTNEATAYIYGMAIVKPTLSGAATGGIKGSITLIPDESGQWVDTTFTG